MALIGSLGVGGLFAASSTGSAVASSDTAPDPAFKTFDVVGDEDWMHDTIQEAHDSLPDGGDIYVAASYDSTDEEFPITLHNHVRIRGGHRGARATTIDAEGSGENVFEIREGYDDGNRPYGLTHSIESIRIYGGEIGILISPETSATIRDVIVTNTNSHGVAGIAQDGNSGSSFMNYLSNVHVFNGGANGFHFPFTSTNYVTRLQYCIAWRNAGIGANIGGHVSAVVGGVYQNNGHHGVRFDKWAANQYAQNLYVAGNGDETRFDNDHEYSANIQVYDSHAVIEDCYIIANDFGGTADRGVDIKAGSDVHVRNCLFRDHEEGSIFVDEDSSNCDLHLNTHIHQDESTILQDNGRGTRSNGILLPTDLKAVENDRGFGRRGDYDIGFDDGTNTESGDPAIALRQDGDWYGVELDKL